MGAKVKCRILRETPDALHVTQDSKTHGRFASGTWIPRSQCDHISKGPQREDGSRDATVTVAEWLVSKSGLKAEEE